MQPLHQSAASTWYVFPVDMSPLCENEVWWSQIDFLKETNMRPTWKWEAPELPHDRLIFLETAANCETGTG